MLKRMQGILTISLDFELLWGFRDLPNCDKYIPSVRGTRLAIPAILKLFEQYKIHATWATVGLLMNQNLESIQRTVPKQIPTYTHHEFSPYRFLSSCMSLDPEMYLACDLLKHIRSTPGQEIGSHTYCHYYALEMGQTAEQFRADLKAAFDIAQTHGIKLLSLVFPRNQVNQGYLKIVTEAGILCYRGNPTNILYRPLAKHHQTPWIRAARFLDAYLPLTGSHLYDLRQLASSVPFNVPASSFLRPYNQRLRPFEALRCRRILRDMTKAAKTGKLYHLWWHPHNFGLNTSHNLYILQKILQHFTKLQHEFGMQSFSMSEVAIQLVQIRNAVL